MKVATKRELERRRLARRTIAEAARHGHTHLVVRPHRFTDRTFGWRRKVSVAIAEELEHARERHERFWAEFN